MDNSQWLNQTAGINGHHHNKNVGNRIDLTLKLGLPDQNPPMYQLGPYVPPASMAPNYHLNQLSAENNTQGHRMNLLGMVNHVGNAQDHQSSNGSQYAKPISDQMASTVHNINNANGFSHFSSPSLGVPTYNNSNDNFAPTHHHQPQASSPLPESNNTLIDIPPRRTLTDQHQRELGSSSVPGSGKRVQRRQRGGNYYDLNKRCTNCNCNTNDTPMWRRGPLGPKTLCNACGIKYRKEEEKKRAKEAESKAEQS